MSLSSKNVFVAVIDGDVDSFRTVRAALKLANQTGVVHAIQITPPPNEAGSLAEELLTPPPKTLQRRLTTRLSDYGLGVALAVVLEGDPVEEVLDHLHETNASAVIMTRRSWKPISDLLFGRPSERITLRSPCSSLVLPKRTDDMAQPIVAELPFVGAGPHVDGPIVVAWDGSPASRQALEVAASMASEADHLHVVQLLPAFESSAPGGVWPREDYPLRNESALFHMKQMLDEKGLARAHPIVEFGPPARRLVSIARSVDAVLIVAGSERNHEHAGFATASFVLRLLKRTFCPVLHAGAPLRRVEVQSALQDATQVFRDI